MTTYFSNYDTSAKEIISHVGKKIVIGVPLGLGKPIGLLNALYTLASADKSINLTIITGLTFSRPVLKNTLEKRFIEPILDRVLKDYEDPLYEKARESQTLPSNINIIEFFLTPGKFLHNNYVQQNYISSSYTNVIRDVIALSINVLAQQVAPPNTHSKSYSLSCNTDLFHGIQEYLKCAESEGKKIAVIAEVNSNLPFMYGETAEVDDGLFSHIIDTKNYRALFAVPRDELSIQDHLIGLYTSCLLKDDSCLQIGIGKLSNALANALILRHKENTIYADILKQLNVSKKFGEIILKIGALDIFDIGLYASTEMFSDEYMQLYKAGILKKRVSGKIIHAGFFFGSVDFYHQLRNLSHKELQTIEMTSISRTNSLLWNPKLLQQQRQHARFVNSSLMVTLLGGIISDGLKDYQEISGVGGQYDFVSMANQLPDAHSIINCRSTRETKNGVASNIVWDYSNSTIARYLRDVVITEYGIADCRSKTDTEVIKALLNIADSRFQPNLLNNAKKSGKIAPDYQIPEIYRKNHPETIEKIVQKFQSRGYFKPYPFGSDLTPEEEILARVLIYLKNCSTLKLFSLLIYSFFFKTNQNFDAYLHRMNLKNPKRTSDYFYKKLLTLILHRHQGQFT